MSLEYEPSSEPLHILAKYLPPTKLCRSEMCWSFSRQLTDCRGGCSIAMALCCLSVRAPRLALRQRGQPLRAGMTYSGSWNATRWSTKVSFGPDSGVLRDQIGTTYSPKNNRCVQLTLDERVVRGSQDPFSISVRTHRLQTRGTNADIYIYIYIYI